jgi:pilus assembly protein CpaC
MTGFIKRLCGAACLVLLGLATPALTTAASAASDLVPSASTAIDLSVGKGRLVRLSRPANSVFIADPAIADVEVKSPMLIYIFGKSSGSTTLYAVGEHDDVLLNDIVQVHYDAAQVQQAIHDLVPRSAVAVSSVDDALVLTGTVYSAADGDDIKRITQRFIKDPKQLIDKMKIDAPTQINLRVRVAEVSRNIVKQFGINWQNVFNNGTFAFGLVTSGAALISNQSTGGTSSTVFPLLPGSSTTGFNTQNSSLVGGATNNNLFAGFNHGSVSANTLIDALDNHGLITVLAEPNLTAVSGEPAKFLAGGEFPVPVPAGTGLVGIEWKQFGVSLTFVGTITDNNRISLHVMPEVSELSTVGAIVIDSISVPSLTTRRAETTVELASGQTFAIGGLLQNNVTQDLNKFPWLGDIPVLGQLFRSEGFQRGETELVILVTPYIVHPIASATAALTPTEGYIPSTDGQLVLQGSEYQQQPAGTTPSSAARRTSLVGPVGFDLE